MHPKESHQLFGVSYRQRCVSVWVAITSKLSPWMKKGISKPIYQNERISEIFGEIRKPNAQENPNSVDSSLPVFSELKEEKVYESAQTNTHLSSPQDFLNEQFVDKLSEPPSVMETPVIKKQVEPIYPESVKHVSVGVDVDVQTITPEISGSPTISSPITNLNSEDSIQESVITNVNISKNIVQESKKNELSDDAIRASTIIPSKRDIPIGLRISQFITVI